MDRIPGCKREMTAHLTVLMFLYYRINSSSRSIDVLCNQELRFKCQATLKAFHG